MFKHCIVMVFSALPIMAIAETVLDQTAVSICVTGQIAADAPVADCVTRAHAVCLDYSIQAPAAAVLCFRQAQGDWAGQIAAQLAMVQPKLDDTAYGALEITTRYDLAQNLLQCDRMHELTLLKVPGGEVVAAQKARCAATASGLAYLRLALQTNDILESVDQ